MLTGPIVGWFWQGCHGQRRAAAGPEPAVPLAVCGAGAAGGARGLQEWENPLVMPPVPRLPGARPRQFSRRAGVLGSVWCWRAAPPGWRGARWLRTKQHSWQLAALKRLNIQTPSFLLYPKRISDNGRSIAVCCSAGYLCCTPAAVRGDLLGREQPGLK